MGVVHGWKHGVLACGNCRGELLGDESEISEIQE
jgi:hypothetical protein